jgi:hypothetical protein
MKKITVLFFLFPLFVKAQTDSSAKKDSIVKIDSAHLRLRDKATGRSIFKVNLSSIALGNYSLSYELRLANKVSFSLGYRFMPKGAIPFSSNLQDAAGTNSDINFNLFQMGNYAVTPEFRFYAHKNMRGFYMAPYARYASFDVTLPVKYSVTQSGQTINENALFNGTITSFSGGLLFGTQHNLGKHVVIDIWIIGIHAGSSNGLLNATFSPPLSNAAAPPGYKNPVQSLQAAIDGINAEPFKITGKVNLDPGGLTASTATLNSSGPWYGIRGLGINLGIRF